LPTPTKTAFEARYCVKQQVNPGQWRIVSYRNVQELHGYVLAVTSRVTKAECLDLPPKIHTRRYVSLSGEQARIYRELKRDAVARIRSAKAEGELTIQNILSESLRLLQVVGGFIPDDSGHVHELPEKAKLEALREVIEDLPTDEPLVIWC